MVQHYTDKIGTQSGSRHQLSLRAYPCLIVFRPRSRAVVGGSLGRGSILLFSIPTSFSPPLHHYTSSSHFQRFIKWYVLTNPLAPIRAAPPARTRSTCAELISQNPLLAASSAVNPSNGVDDDKLSDYVPGSRDLSVSRAVSDRVASSRMCGCCTLVSSTSWQHGDADGQVEESVVWRWRIQARARRSLC